MAAVKVIFMCEKANWLTHRLRVYQMLSLTYNSIIYVVNGKLKLSWLSLALAADFGASQLVDEKMLKIITNQLREYDRDEFDFHSHCSH
ncbi:hypothetical protein [Microcoleus vaginatus]|uniref:hypothetical protein n=1 Tax=Microcoleus vaginatus TaxID=119532 RepID=UPI00020D2FE2|nr:hypothetical protein MicvaDRAFT_5062 [Microcoleus vaginatus FGP-2]